MASNPETDDRFSPTAKPSDRPPSQNTDAARLRRERAKPKVEARPLAKPDTTQAEQAARDLVARQANGSLSPDDLRKAQDDAAATVKANAKSQKDLTPSGIQALLQGSLGRVTLSTRLPPEVVAMTHGVPDDATLQKAMSIYNASSHTGVGAKDATEFETLLANRDTQAIMALSQTVGGEPTTGVNVPLGPAFGGKEVFLNATAQKAYQTYWPTAFANIGTVVQGAQLTGVPHQLLAAASEANRRLLAGSPMNTDAERQWSAVGAALGEADLSQRLEEGMKMYGDHTLALIYTRDPSIADKIKNGVPLSADDQSTVRQLFVDAQYSDKSMADAGLAIDPRKFAYVNNLVGGDGSSAAVVKLPNHEEVQQALETVYRAWFMQAPSADTMAAFTGQVNAAAAASQKGVTQGGSGNPYQQTSPSGGGLAVEDAPSLPSAAIDYARKDPQYARFFGNKPVNLDESAYAQQFSNTAQRFFGDAGAGQADAIGQGMESGDVNQTVGHLAAQGNAMDNATFRETLARAAEAIGKMV